jgi:MinD-like ATPase involved in chromosome partitioning or flagellar assembly
MKIAFHSYKGGVGRTKVMLGVGAILAMRGHRVGMLDFDLDASGVAASLGADPAKIGKRELLNILNRPDPAKVLDALIDVTEFVGARFNHQPQKPGCLKYIPTISDPRLSDKIKFDEAGCANVDTILNTMLQDCGVDQLLIDLKPGYSPSSAAIFPLVDQAVVVTRLDRQNIEGLAKIVPLMKSKHITPTIVANYILDSPLTEARIDLLTKTMGSRIDVRIQFDPDVFFDDDISCVAQEGSAINVSLKALASLLEKKLSAGREQAYVQLG